MELKRQEIFSVHSPGPTRKKYLQLLDKDKKKNYAHYWFPFYCKYIAWALCVAIIISCVVVLFLYGVTFGETKSLSWLTAVLLSMLLSIFLVQPIRVLALAIFSSYILKWENSLAPHWLLKQQLENEHDEEKAALADAIRTQYGGCYQSQLPNTQRARRYEVRDHMELKQFAFDVFTYILFLIALYILVYSKKTSTAYYSTETIKNLVIDAKYTKSIDMYHVNTYEKFLEYMYTTIIPALLTLEGNANDSTPIVRKNNLRKNGTNATRRTLDDEDWDAYYYDDLIGIRLGNDTSEEDFEAENEEGDDEDGNQEEESERIDEDDNQTKEEYDDNWSEDEDKESGDENYEEEENDENENEGEDEEEVEEENEGDEEVEEESEGEDEENEEEGNEDEGNKEGGNNEERNDEVENEEENSDEAENEKNRSIHTDLFKKKDQGILSALRKRRNSKTIDYGLMRKIDHQARRKEESQAPLKRFENMPKVSNNRATKSNIIYLKKQNSLKMNQFTPLLADHSGNLNRQKRNELLTPYALIRSAPKITTTGTTEKASSEVSSVSDPSTSSTYEEKLKDGKIFTKYDLQGTQSNSIIWTTPASTVPVETSFNVTSQTILRNATEAKNDHVEDVSGLEPNELKTSISEKVMSDRLTTSGSTTFSFKDTDQTNKLLETTLPSDSALVAELTESNVEANSKTVEGTTPFDILESGELAEESERIEFFSEKDGMDMEIRDSKFEDNSSSLSSIVEKEERTTTTFDEKRMSSSVFFSAIPTSSVNASPSIDTTHSNGTLNTSWEATAQENVKPNTTFIAEEEFEKVVSNTNISYKQDATLLNNGSTIEQEKLSPTITTPTVNEQNRSLNSDPLNIPMNESRPTLKNLMEEEQKVTNAMGEQINGVAVPDRLSKSDSPVKAGLETSTLNFIYESSQNNPEFSGKQPETVLQASTLSEQSATVQNSARMDFLTGMDMLSIPIQEISFTDINAYTSVASTHSGVSENIEKISSNQDADSLSPEPTFTTASSSIGIARTTLYTPHLPEEISAALSDSDENDTPISVGPSEETRDSLLEKISDSLLAEQIIIKNENLKSTYSSSLQEQDENVESQTVFTIPTSQLIQRKAYKIPPKKKIKVTMKPIVEKVTDISLKEDLPSFRLEEGVNGSIYNAENVTQTNLLANVSWPTEVLSNIDDAVKNQSMQHNPDEDIMSFRRASDEDEDDEDEKEEKSEDDSEKKEEEKLPMEDGFMVHPIPERGWTLDNRVKLLGKLMLRQQRVQRVSCYIHPDVVDLIRTENCAAEMNSLNEEGDDYTVGWDQFREREPRIGGEEMEPWKYRTPWRLDGIFSIGQLKSTYSGGGYIMPLGKTIPNAITALNFMDYFDWIDMHTRVVFLEFTTYSVDANLFNVVTIMFEVSASGFFVPTYEIQTIQLFDNSKWVWVILVFLIILFVVIIFLLTMREGIRMKRTFCFLYCTDFWTWVDIAILVMSFGLLLTFVARFLLINTLLREIETKPSNEFINFQSAAFLEQFTNFLSAFVVCLATSKAFKLLTIYTKFHYFERVFKDGKYYLTALSIVVTLGIIAYSCALTIILGDTYEKYRSFWVTFPTMTLLANRRSRPGSEFDDNEWPVVAIIFYISMFIFISLIITSLFWGIIIVSLHYITEHPVKSHYELGKSLQYLWKKDIPPRSPYVVPLPSEPVFIADRQGVTTMSSPTIDEVKLQGMKRIALEILTQKDYIDEIGLNIAYIAIHGESDRPGTEHYSFLRDKGYNIYEPQSRLDQMKEIADRVAEEYSSELKQNKDRVGRY